MPAAAAGSNRHCVSGSGLHPFQRGWLHGLVKANGALQRFFIDAASRGAAPPNRLPVTNSAIVRFSSSVILPAFVAIGPVVSAARTPSGVNWRSASRLGARLSGPGLSWQVAQCSSNPITCLAVEPGTFGDCEGGGCVHTAAEP